MSDKSAIQQTHTHHQHHPTPPHAASVPDLKLLFLIDLNYHGGPGWLWPFRWIVWKRLHVAKCHRLVGIWGKLLSLVHQTSHSAATAAATAAAINGTDATDATDAGAIADCLKPNLWVSQKLLLTVKYSAGFLTNILSQQESIFLNPSMRTFMLSFIMDNYSSDSKAQHCWGGDSSNHPQLTRWWESIGRLSFITWQNTASALKISGWTPN